MRRFGIILFCWLAALPLAALAGTFLLTDGTKITGKPMAMNNEKGVVFELEDGTASPRISWDRLTGDALKELMAEATTDNERALLQPMVENLPQEVAKRKEIVVTPVQTPPRPKPAGVFALLASPVGWMIALVLYGANLFAAYEVAIYRRQPILTVCGLAAVPLFGVLSPIIFGAMPTQLPPPEPSAEAPVEQSADTAPEVAAAESAAAPAPAAVAAVEARAAVKAALPEPVVFQKGDYSFNRRFFETRFAGFFRVIPTEAEKDLVLVINASRGQFTGRRISRITAGELFLQVFNKDASADEMIPFVEITEVQIRHKDTL